MNIIFLFIVCCLASDDDEESNFNVYGWLSGLGSALTVLALVLLSLVNVFKTYFGYKYQNQRIDIETNKSLNSSNSEDIKELIKKELSNINLINNEK